MMMRFLVLALAQSILLSLFWDYTECSKSFPEASAARILEAKHSKVFIYDGIFRERMLYLLSELVRRYAPWTFIYADPEIVEENKKDGNLHWLGRFHPEDFTRSKVWEILKQKLPNFFAEKEYFPYEIKSVLINRGDFPTLQKGKNTGDLLIRIFVTENVRKNDYSELVFYTENEEIFGSVFPKYGRVVVWNDTADFIFKPPSMKQFGGEYSIFIKATMNKDKYKEAVNKHKEKAKQRSRMAEEPFPLTNISDNAIQSINLTKHLTRKFHDQHNRVIAVFDDIVPVHILKSLQKYFLKYDSSYVYNVYDPAYDESHDNVNWVAQVPAELLPLSQVWQYVHHVASYLSGETGWYPYDVSMNIIQHIHHPRIHADCKDWEHEYTFLMYLTPDWSQERYGETIFFESSGKKKRGKVRPGDEQYETITAVTPKFGRIVIFRNIIEHSARPPSPDFLAARYTFAVKVGRSPQIAIGKKLYELLGDLTGNLDKESRRLMKDIEKGKYDEIGDSSKEGFLNDKYLQYKQKKSLIDRKSRGLFYKKLSILPKGS